MTKKNKKIFKYDNKLLKFSRKPEGVLAILENNYVIESKLIIGADGKNSYLRKLANIEYRHKDYKQKAFTFNIKSKSISDLTVL